MTKEKESQKTQKNLVPDKNSQELDPQIAELSKLFDIVDPEKKQELIALISEHVSSPVPPDSFLKGYNEVVENGAQWLLNYTKDEQKHRHKMENREWLHYWFGQVFAFTLGLAGIVGGIYLGIIGAELTGFGTFFTSFAALIGLFIYNKKTDKN